MKNRGNNSVIIFILICLQINISGCADIKKGYAEVKKQAEYCWEKIKYEFSDKQTGTRENAVQKYKIRTSNEKLIVESPVISPNIANPGQKIKQELQYAVFSPQEEKKINVTESVCVATGADTIEITKRESLKKQGIHSTITSITIPKDLNPGEYKIITTISTKEQKKSVTGSFWVKK